MKRTRDTFYVALRDRLQTLNPSRQVSIRGVWRPGILVEENESFAAQAPDNVFVLRWTGVTIDDRHALTRTEQSCEVQYQTAGTAASGGLDRGSLLAAMDAELVSLLQPEQAPKMDYSQTPAAAMGTRIFWASPIFHAATRDRDRVVRRVAITVVSYEEAGGL